jgi:uncharacterized protein (TIRG00374 family)
VRSRAARRRLLGAAGIALSLVLIAWVLREVRWREVMAHMAAADLPLLAVSIVTVTLTFPARAVRWRILLAQQAPDRPFAPFWDATAIGFMANNILPARAGELARAVAGGRLLSLPVSTVLGSVAVERVFDGLVIVLLMALAIASPGFPADVSVRGTSVSDIATLMGAFFAAALVVLLGMVHAPHSAMQRLGRLVSRLLPERAAAAALRLVRNAIAGLAVLKAPRDFARVVVWSLVVWLLNAGAYYVGLFAFGITGLPFTSMLFLQGLVALGVAIPAAPGFFGLFEALCLLALGLYGVGEAAAVSYAIGIHLSWFLPITAIGLWKLGRTGLSLREIRQAENGP